MKNTRHETVSSIRTRVRTSHVVAIFTSLITNRVTYHSIKCIQARRISLHRDSMLMIQIKRNWIVWSFHPVSIHHFTRKKYIFGCGACQIRQRFIHTLQNINWNSICGNNLQPTLLTWMIRNICHLPSAYAICIYQLGTTDRDPKQRKWNRCRFHVFYRVFNIHVLEWMPWLHIIKKTFSTWGCNIRTSIPAHICKHLYAYAYICIYICLK